ncbi:hypothetical protein RCH06_003523 [Polaromonas sp. CG_9.5]|nr:hypothetical protein [Polaromonas sp. CG_9.5]
MTDIAGPHHTHPNGEIDLIRKIFFMIELILNYLGGR